MQASVYVPKWLIFGSLGAAGCLAGWMIGDPPSVFAQEPAAGTATSSAAASTGSSTAHPGRAAGHLARAARAAAPAAPVKPASVKAAARPNVAYQGSASTPNSNIRIVRTADGYSGEANTPNSTIRIVRTPHGYAGEATTPNSTVTIDPVATHPKASAGSGGSTAARAVAPAASKARAATAGNTATTTGAATGGKGAHSTAKMPAAAATAAGPASVRSAAQSATPAPPAPVGVGDWGAPGALPPLVSPPLFAADLWTPLPGAKSRGVAFSEWESYRTDVAGENILVTTDDSNFFRDRTGKIKANTGDIDASGLNVMDTNDSVIHGSESADEAPYQTVADALVDLAYGKGSSAEPPSDDEGDDEDSSDDEDSDEGDAAEPPEANGDLTARTADLIGAQPTRATKRAALRSPAATAAVISPLTEDSGDDSSEEGFDFPYTQWVKQASNGTATAVHTDEGTTLASGADAIVIGGDGYDDDDNRAVGENIVLTRDDDNVVIGGVGDVDAQIGDAEQGGLVMDVNRSYIQGGGAY